MSKYEPLWNYVKEQENDFILNYEQVEKNSRISDRSFLPDIQKGTDELRLAGRENLDEKQKR